MNLPVPVARWLVEHHGDPPHQHLVARAVVANAQLLLVDHARVGAADLAPFPQQFALQSPVLANHKEAALRRHIEEEADDAEVPVGDQQLVFLQIGDDAVENRGLLGVGILQQIGTFEALLLEVELADHGAGQRHGIQAARIGRCVSRSWTGDCRRAPSSGSDRAGRRPADAGGVDQFRRPGGGETHGPFGDGRFEAVEFAVIGDGRNGQVPPVLVVGLVEVPAQAQGDIGNGNGQGGELDVAAGIAGRGTAQRPSRGLPSARAPGRSRVVTHKRLFLHEIVKGHRIRHRRYLHTGAHLPP